MIRAARREALLADGNIAQTAEHPADLAGVCPHDRHNIHQGPFRWCHSRKTPSTRGDQLFHDTVSLVFSVCTIPSHFLRIPTGMSSPDEVVIQLGAEAMPLGGYEGV